MSTFRMWEVFAKADEGPFYKDQGEWMLKSFIPNIRRVVKEYNIKYDGHTIVNQDDDLADTFYGLGLDGFQQVYDLNFKGTLLATMVFTTDMIEAGKGNVLNISSMNAIRPLTKIPAYSAAKGSINNFTQWYAVHVAQLGIRCNAIAPGFFLTDQNRFLLTDEQTAARTAEEIVWRT